MPLYQRVQATVLASFPDTITARAVPLPVVLFLHGSLQLADFAQLAMRANCFFYMEF